MPTFIEQKVPYNRNVTVPIAEVPPGEDLSFPFISLWLERMNFLAKCAVDNEKSELFIVGEGDIDRKNGLVVVRNSALIPISSLYSGQHMVFQLKRKPGSPVAEIKVSHI